MQTTRWLTVLSMLLGAFTAAVPLSAGPAPGGTSDALRDKLKSIVIPKLELDKATVAQTVAFLRQRSQELDPDGQGVNIILQLAPAPAGGGTAAPTITLNLNRVPLGEVLRYVCMQADLKFAVENNAVIIADKITPIEGMQTRTYRVKPGVFETVETKPRQHLTDK